MVPLAVPARPRVVHLFHDADNRIDALTVGALDLLPQGVAVGIHRVGHRLGENHVVVLLRELVLELGVR